MTTGTSDTWQPNSFLRVTYKLKLRGELVKVIPGGEAAPATQNSHKSQTVGLDALSSRGHLTHCYDDLCREEVPSL